MYSRLSASSEHGGGGGGGGGGAELVSSHGGTSSPSSSSEAFTIRVMDKEKVVTLPAGLLTGNSSVGELKTVVSRECGVDFSSVRLIFSGKLLNPNDKPLSFFAIKPNSIIHLFPILFAAPTAVPTATSVASAASGGGAAAMGVDPTPATDAAPAINLAETFDPAALTLDTLYLDPYIAQTCREVRLWSLLLLTLSAVSVFNNFNQVSVSGSLGDSSLDATVFLLDTACNLAGVYVAQLGLASSRTQDFSTIKRYVRLLTLLAMASFITRALWAADVVVQVKQALRSSRGADDAGDGADVGVPNGIRGGSAASQLEDDANPNPVLTSNAVTTFAVRAAVICIICVAAWLSCWIRAYRLQYLVGSVIAAQQPPAPADVSVTVDAEAYLPGVAIGTGSNPMHAAGSSEGRRSRDAVVTAVMTV